MQYFKAFLIGLIFLFPAVLANAAKRDLFGVPIGATESQFLPEFKESKFECSHKTEYAVQCVRGKDIPPVQHLYYFLTRSSQSPLRVYLVQYNFDKKSLKPTDVIDQINEMYAARPLFYDPSTGCLAGNPCHVTWGLDHGILVVLNLNGPSSDGFYRYELKIGHVATMAQEMGMENPIDGIAKELNQLKNALEDAKK